MDGGIGDALAVSRQPHPVVADRIQSPRWDARLANSWRNWIWKNNTAPADRRQHPGMFDRQSRREDDPNAVAATRTPLQPPPEILNG